MARIRGGAPAGTGRAPGPRPAQAGRRSRRPMTISTTPPPFSPRPGRPDYQPPPATPALRSPAGPPVMFAAPGQYPDRRFAGPGILRVQVNPVPYPRGNPARARSRDRQPTGRARRWSQTNPPTAKFPSYPEQPAPARSRSRRRLLRGYSAATPVPAAYGGGTPPGGRPPGPPPGPGGTAHLVSRGAAGSPVRVLGDPDRRARRGRRRAGGRRGGLGHHRHPAVEQRNVRRRGQRRQRRRHLRGRPDHPAGRIRRPDRRGRQSAQRRGTGPGRDRGRRRRGQYRHDHAGAHPGGRRQGHRRFAAAGHLDGQAR